MIILIEIPTEIKGQIKEVEHIMSEHKITNILPLLILLMKQPNSNLQFSVLILSHKNNNRLHINDILFNRPVIIQSYDFT